MRNKKICMLVFTDHSTHTEENSFYGIVSALVRQPTCHALYVASRATKSNRNFFKKGKGAKRVNKSLRGFQVKEQITYKHHHSLFEQPTTKIKITDVNAIFLRLPHPINKETMTFFKDLARKKTVINDPRSLEECGSKKYLLHFKNLCPEMKLCKTKKDIVSFANKFPIVLKPLESHGGKGIVKIDNGYAYNDKKRMPFNTFLKQWQKNKKPFLGMKFVSNVAAGDKRICVVNGKIICASLRKPAEGKWLCNASQGGVASIATITTEERMIAKEVGKILLHQGIVIFGFDTLEDNNRRVLSEINVMSIGGFIQSERMTKRPILKEVAKKILDYIEVRIKE
jgi:glutathione synthase